MNSSSRSTQWRGSRDSCVIVGTVLSVQCPALWYISMFTEHFWTFLPLFSLLAFTPHQAVIPHSDAKGHLQGGGTGNGSYPIVAVLQTVGKERPHFPALEPCDSSWPESYHQLELSAQRLDWVRRRGGPLWEPCVEMRDETRCFYWCDYFAVRNWVLKDKTCLNNILNITVFAFNKPRGIEIMNIIPSSSVRKLLAAWNPDEIHKQTLNHLCRCALRKRH